MPVTFSVIVPTMGRDTLTRTLASVAPQLEHGDELLVGRLDCTYGNQARDNAMAKATGTHLLFLDDDDAYTPDALATMRQAIAVMPDRVHIFRMRYDHGLVLWYAPALASGNIGTPMVAIPNQPGRLGVWAAHSHYESDFAFIHDTVRLRDDEPVFHEDIVALVRPTAGKEYASG
jgi:glycosyltransferase involved in cell wall biosynthesis